MNRVGKCFAFWSKCNKMQWLEIAFVILLILMPGGIQFDAIALVVITVIGEGIFSELTFTLSFSRKNIWTVYALLETVILSLYLIIKFIRYFGNLNAMMIELFFVLIAHMITSYIPKKRSMFWIGVTIALVVVSIAVLRYGYPQINRLVQYILCNRQMGIGLVITNICMIFADIFAWKIGCRLMVKGEHYV